MTSVSRRRADCKPTPSISSPADNSTRALVVVPPEQKAEPEAKDFDWNSDDLIILHEQPETAVIFQ